MSSERMPLVAKVIDYQARQITYNVYSYYKSRKLDPSTTEHKRDINLIDIVAKVTGLSKSTVARVIREGNAMKAKTGTTQFKPKPKIKHSRRKRIQIDDFTEGVIRRKVIQFYTMKKEVPSIRKLNALLIEEDILHCSVEYLRQLLHKLGFTNTDSGEETSNNVFVERSDINLERLKYLSALKEFRAQDRSIFFLNDTSQWTSNQEHDHKNLPSIIVVHVSGSTGFVEGNLLMIRSKNKAKSNADSPLESIESFGNYHWVLEKFLPNILPCAVVVVNTPVCDDSFAITDETDIPPSSLTRSQMQEWLTKNNVPFKDTDAKPDLLKRIRDKQTDMRFALDKLLKDHGHEVLYLPEKHHDLNPIITVWDIIKKESKNIAPKTLFSRYGTENWKKCFDKVIENENEYYENGIKRDEALDNVKLKVKEEYHSSDSDMDFDE